MKPPLSLDVPAAALPPPEEMVSLRNADPAATSVYTSEEAPGAWRNGTRVEKTEWVEGDPHGPGALGTVRGSVGPAEIGGEVVYGYFVEWDDLPGKPIFVAGPRLRTVGEGVQRSVLVTQTECTGGTYGAAVEAAKAAGQDLAGVIVAFEKKFFGVFEAEICSLLPLDTQVIALKGRASCGPGTLVEAAQVLADNPPDLVGRVPIRDVPHREWCFVPLRAFAEGAYPTDEKNKILVAEMKRSMTTQADAIRRQQGRGIAPTEELCIYVERKGVGFSRPRS